MNQADFSILKRLLTRSQIVIWPTLQNSLHGEAPASSMVVGFLRSIRTENETLRAVTVALENDSTIETKSEIITRCYSQALFSSNQDVEHEYEERAGAIGTVRLKEALPLNESLSRTMLPQEPQATPLGDGTRPMKLTIGSPGLLNTLHWVDDAGARTPVTNGELEIKVECAGLNFLDLLTALGQVNKNFMGGEAAGVVVQSGDRSKFKPGDRVACVVFGAFKSFARCEMLHAVRIPDTVDFRSAAALPVIYCTSYYSLVHKAHLKRGETVLVHSGAGGFGQATIQLAQLEGAEVYATVSNDSKRDFLISRYSIPADHIFSSRSCRFADQIRAATRGRGVDVVVNSLSGEKLRASWECVAPFGRFIEVGKKDIETFQDLPMKRFSGNVSFSGVDLVHLAAGDPKLTNKILQVVIDLFTAGKISVPEEFRVYDASRMEEAYRYMQSGKAVGKAVFELRPEDIVQAMPDSSVSSYNFNPDATYVISGGLGGLGRSAARWMAQRGARHLILLSRREPNSYGPEVVSFLDELEEIGVNVARPTCDVSDYEMTRAVLASCLKTMPTIKGCLLGSMVLQDSSFKTMSLSTFQTATRPKVQGSWNLHKLLPEDLDFFILLSSAAGIIGNHGQCNYSAGNTFQDGLARHRIRHGQKAISFDLGLMQSIGYVATQLGAEYSNNLLSSNAGMTEAEFLAMLEVFCNPRLAMADESTAQVVSGISTAAMCRARGVEDAYWLEKPLFRYLHQIDSSRAAASAPTKSTVDYASMLKQTNSVADATDIICEAIVQKLSRAIAIDAQDVDVGKPLHIYGIDSLSAVELRSWFARELHADVAVLDILGKNTIADLSSVVAELSRLIPLQAKKATDAVI